MLAAFIKLIIGNLQQVQEIKYQKIKQTEIKRTNKMKKCT